MNKQLIIGLFLLLAACGGGGGAAGNDTAPSPSEPDREGPPPLIPDTPQAEVPPVSASWVSTRVPGS